MADNTGDIKAKISTFVGSRADNSLVDSLSNYLTSLPEITKASLIGLTLELLRSPAAAQLVQDAAREQLINRIHQTKWAQLPVDKSTISSLLSYCSEVTDSLGLHNVTVPVMLRCISAFPKTSLNEERKVQEFLLEFGITGLSAPAILNDADWRYAGLGYGIDLNQKMVSESEPPLVEREKELEELLTILLAERSPILTGDPGVGKSALVEGLAWHLSHGSATIPRELQNIKIVAIQVSDMISDSSLQGQLEKRLNSFVEHLGSKPNVIVFIDEIHALFSGNQQAGQTIVDTIKPPMARGKLRLIGATTEREYQRYFASDRALRQRFRSVKLKEFSQEQAIKIIKQRGANLFSGSVRLIVPTVEPKAIEAAVKLSKAHFKEDPLPRKPIYILQEAAANTAFRQARISSNSTTTLKEEDVIQVVSRELGIDPSMLSGEPQIYFKRLREEFHKHIIGQDQAIEQILEGLCGSLFNKDQAEKPQAIILFSGPSGVGKSLACKVIAEVVCGNPQACFSLAMNEYLEDDARNKLAGAGPGYRDSSETWTVYHAVRARPSSVVVFDGVDFINPALRSPLVKILSGQAADAMGYQTDFSKSIFILVTGETLYKNLSKASDEDKKLILADAFGGEIARKIEQEVHFQTLEQQHLREIIKQKINQKLNSDDHLTQELWQSFADDTKIEAFIDVARQRGGSAEDALFALQQTFKKEAWQQIQSSTFKN